MNGSLFRQMLMIGKFTVPQVCAIQRVCKTWLIWTCPPEDATWYSSFYKPYPNYGNQNLSKFLIGLAKSKIKS
jgi:hypothetical protein